MRKLWAAILTAGALRAGVIRGVVVENQTGKPLLRAVVTLKPVPGTRAPTYSVRTNAYGIFDFPPVPGGAYLVSAARRDFATIQYGQKDWRSAGAPVLIDDTASTFLNIRLPRLGAISGRIVDENDVGLPNHEVVAYRNTRPPQLVSRVTADERGVFRVFDLDPGSYLVRTVAREYDEGSYVPTFSKESTRVDEARAVEVQLDQDVDRVEVRPAMGKLWKIGGAVLPGAMDWKGDPVSVKLTLASDMGRETQSANKTFRFNPVPPGQYEIYAEGPGDGSSRCPMTGGYVPVEMKDADALEIRVPAPCVRDTSILVTEGHGQPYVGRGRLQLLTRRKDLAGTGEIQTFDIDAGRYNASVKLPPGRWELMLVAPPGYCVTEFSFTRPRSDGLEHTRADGWNEVLIGANYASIRYTLSRTPGTLHGLVSGISREPVGAAPVYVEGYDPESRRRVAELKSGVTDMRGQYVVGGLSPGWYRVLSTFEFQSPDAAAMEMAGAKLVKVEEGRDVTQDLDLSFIR